MNYNKMYVNSINELCDSFDDYEYFFNKNILITGSTGLIGSTLIDFLSFINNSKSLNLNIYCSGRNEMKFKKRFENNPYFSSLNFVYYDVTKPIDFNIPVDFIIHAASNAHPSAYVNYPVETMLGNIIGVNNLLKYALKFENNRFLFVSSSEVYGIVHGKGLLEETDNGYIDFLDPRSCYPSSKRASETLCSSYKKEYNQDFVIVRPGHIYGPTITDEDSRASAQFSRKSLNKENIVLKSEGTQLRSYTHVFDCVTSILKVLVSGESGEAYNISNRNSIVTIKELAEEFARQTNTEVVYDIPTEKEKAGYNAMSNSALNSTKIEKLGWVGKYNIENGIKNTLEVMKERGKINE